MPSSSISCGCAPCTPSASYTASRTSSRLSALRCYPQTNQWISTHFQAGWCCEGDTRSACVMKILEFFCDHVLKCLSWPMQVVKSHVPEFEAMMRELGEAGQSARGIQLPADYVQKLRCEICMSSRTTNSQRRSAQKCKMSQEHGCPTARHCLSSLLFRDGDTVLGHIVASASLHTCTHPAGLSKCVDDKKPRIRVLFRFFSRVCRSSPRVFLVGSTRPASRHGWS